MYGCCQVKGLNVGIILMDLSEAFDCILYRLLLTKFKWQWFKIFVSSMGLLISITEPTCHRGDVSMLLDALRVINPHKYLANLNSKCNISDFHNVIGASTRRFAPSLKSHRIVYRSYTLFNDTDFLFDVQCAPFHVTNIFDDANSIDIVSMMLGIQARSSVTS